MQKRVEQTGLDRRPSWTKVLEHSKLCKLGL